MIRNFEGEVLMNKQVLLTTLVLSCILSCAICTAAYRTPKITSSLGAIGTLSCSIYSDQANFAGIHIGDSPQIVRAILGTPSGVTRHNSGYVEYYYKGKTHIEFVDFSGKGILKAITIENSYDATSAIAKTSDGIKLGSTENEVLKAYGAPDEIVTINAEAPKIPEMQRKQYHDMYSKEVYTYHADTTTSMTITIEKGVVSNIRIHQSD